MKFHKSAQWFFCNILITIIIKFIPSSVIKGFLMINYFQKYKMANYGYSTRFCMTNSVLLSTIRILWHLLYLDHQLNIIKCWYFKCYHDKWTNIMKEYSLIAWFSCIVFVFYHTSLIFAYLISNISYACKYIKETYIFNNDCTIKFCLWQNVMCKRWNLVYVKSCSSDPWDIVSLVPRESDIS